MKMQLPNLTVIFFWKEYTWKCI